ncbi:MAG: reverse transcriptase domain-containing protein [Campylobacterota bacterium]|nr:reverse transcriptase domain-containing protein [Campylobacterota bacterium]
MIKQFTTNALLKTFELQKDKISTSFSSGVDGINGKQFSDNIDDEIEIISRKIENGTYRFSKYKKMLIIKSENKTRTISIPTQRDKFVLKILNTILKDSYQYDTKTAKANIVEITQNYKHYDSFIKVDVTNFFPTIDHKILLDILSQKLPEEIISLIQQAISQELNSVGIAQGLPISGMLADIYMEEFDKKYNSKKTIKYYRFVDDVLILSTKYNVTKLKNSIEKDMKGLKLTIHPFGENIDKSFSGNIIDGFQYLGYLFKNNNISVRDASIEKLYININKLFTQYKNIKKKDSLERLLFCGDLNNKITGVKVNNNHYGWIGYFSNIDDMKLLFGLDMHIEKMCVKNGIKYEGKIKKISRAYYELRRNDTKYIPSYSIRTKKVNKIIKDLEDDVLNY